MIDIDGIEKFVGFPKYLPLPQIVFFEVGQLFDTDLYIFVLA